MKASDVKKELRKYASKKRKTANKWFFKTGYGEYGEGDRFIGVSMPDLRKVANEFADLSLVEVKKLLSSLIHEERMTALVILTYVFKKAEKEVEKKRIYDFYLKNKKYINNWDLVDVSTHKIVGAYLLTQPKKERAILKKLARSKSMWDRRIAMVATAMFIHAGELKDTFELSKMLLGDKEDLMHKAVGWMLREAGKKDLKMLEDFIKKNYKKIPRTALRYAIEKFPEKKRQKYLRGTF